MYLPRSKSSLTILSDAQPPPPFCTRIYTHTHTQTQRMKSYCCWWFPTFIGVNNVGSDDECETKNEAAVKEENDVFGFSDTTSDSESESDYESVYLDKNDDDDDDYGGDDAYYGSFDDGDDGDVIEKIKNEPRAILLLEKARAITYKENNGENLTYEEGVERLRLYNNSIRLTVNGETRRARIIEFEEIRALYYRDAKLRNLEVDEMKRLMLIIHQTRVSMSEPGMLKKKRVEMRTGLVARMIDLRNVYRNALLLTDSKDKRTIIRSLYNSLVRG